MAANLSGKVAIVTGGGSGVGRATCLALAKAGATALAADIDPAEAQATAEHHPAIHAIRLDVTSEADWRVGVDGAMQAHGRLDILVNCAGIGFAGRLEDMDRAQWDALVAVNLTGPFLGCKQAIGAMRDGGRGGSIVNISSIAGLVGGEDLAGYSATKGGLTMLTKSVALYCAKHAPGVRCNSVHPTYVDSEMLDPVAAMFPSREIMLAGMASEVPMGRVAVPDDIAHAILFLASDDAAMITGAQLVVDGGQLAGLPGRHST